MVALVALLDGELLRAEHQRHQYQQRVLRAAVQEGGQQRHDRVEVRGRVGGHEERVQHAGGEHGQAAGLEARSALGVRRRGNTNHLLGAAVEQAVVGL